MREDTPAEKCLLCLIFEELFFLIYSFTSTYMFEIYHSFFTLADTGKVDLVMNLVERVSRGFSAGGGISSG